MTYRRPGITDYPDDLPATGWGLLAWIVLAAIAGIGIWGFVVLTLVSLAEAQ